MLKIIIIIIITLGGSFRSQTNIDIQQPFKPLIVEEPLTQLH